MTVLVEDNFAVRLPEIPNRYRANCSKEWGCFVMGDTKKMSSIEAEKAGLTKGKFVEMALCWVEKKILTFEPNYINEEFTEIWGIPVGGEMKAQYNEKCSELSTFLIHRQSKDKLSGLIEVFSREAFNQWVAEGMKGDYQEYALSKAAEFYFTHIFRFEMTQVEGNYGIYYYVQTTFRKPENKVENAALTIARQIYEGQLNGLGYCTDSRLEENQDKCLLALQAQQVEQENVAKLEGGKKTKILKAANA